MLTYLLVILSDCWYMPGNAISALIEGLRSLMIHQFIFAGPKPGLSAEAFTRYWINFHSVDYAAKIPQIRQYLVASRVLLGGQRDLPFFQGVAEIWLNDEADQQAPLLANSGLVHEPERDPLVRVRRGSLTSLGPNQGPTFLHHAPGHDPLSQRFLMREPCGAVANGISSLEKWFAGCELALRL